MRYLNTLLIALLASLALVGCDVDQGPVEEAGEAVDEGVEDAGDAADDMSDEAEDAVE